MNQSTILKKKTTSSVYSKQNMHSRIFPLLTQKEKSVQRVFLHPQMNDLRLFVAQTLRFTRVLSLATAAAATAVAPILLGRSLPFAAISVYQTTVTMQRSPWMC